MLIGATRVIKVSNGLYFFLALR